MPRHDHFLFRMAAIESLEGRQLFAAAPAPTLTLVNAATDKDIGAFVENEVLDLNKLGTQLSVRADVPTKVGSMKFVLDGATLQIEGSAPYAIKGNPNGDYVPWTPTAGKHTLVVTAYSGVKATGIAGAAKTLHFSVIGKTATPTITWKTLAPAPLDLAEAVGTTVNGKLYVLGGFHGLIAPDHYIAQKRCDVYDPATNKWTRIADMPEAFTHAEAVVVGSAIWFVGGYIGNHPGPGTTHVWIYDTAKNVWSRGPDLPVARGAGAATLVGRQIHFIGGMDITRTHDESDHFVLDLDHLSAGWKTLKSMPTARNHVAAATVGGKIYVIGGQLSQEEDQVALSVVECYDTATGKWTKVASLPQGRSHITNSTFVRDGKIIVVGGESGFNVPHNTVYSYDPVANTWSTIGLLPAARSTMVCGLIGDQIIGSTGNSPTNTTTTWLGTLKFV